MDDLEGVVGGMDCLLQMGGVVQLGARMVLEDMGTVRQLEKETEKFLSILVVISKSSGIYESRHDCITSNASKS